MQRLEQLVGKELFARHGRNKLLTEQGIQLLGYARKILRFNDEACMSLMYGSLQGGLTIGASEETADTILPFLLNRIGCFYPRMTLEIKVHPHAVIMAMLSAGEVDLALTTHQLPGFTAFTLRTSLPSGTVQRTTCWRKGNRSPSSCSKSLARSVRTSSPRWRLPASPGIWPRRLVALRGESGGESRAGGHRACGRMMSPDLRVAGISDGLPVLPDTRYVVSCNPQTVGELPQAIFQSLSQESDPWRAGRHLLRKREEAPSFCEVILLTKITKTGNRM